MPSLTPVLRGFCTAAITLILVAGRAAANPVPQIPVRSRTETVLVPSTGPRPYLAFPAILDSGGDRVLVSYKRGRKHGSDPGAVLEFFTIDRRSGKAGPPRLLAADGNRIMQMGEWVRFPNGDIASYIDAQRAEEPSRVGMSFVRSTDGGQTFTGVQRVGVVDGIEYGYPFEFIARDSETLMLAMTFSNLQGGYSVFERRPAAGSVDVIRSEDNGRSWHFVRNLSKEFGNIPINESSFLRVGSGYLVTTRGYDDRERLHLTDAQFRVLKQVNLTENYPFIQRYIGRPRLFARDGRVYLLGRNWTEAAKTGGDREQLCLFRIDPESLAVTAYAILDNAQRANVTDGYYAVPYFHEVDGQTKMAVVTYKGLDRKPPQIVQLEYSWDEIR